MCCFAAPYVLLFSVFLKQISVVDLEDRVFTVAQLIIGVVSGLSLFASI